jgi:DNA gyrase/topoisomerase IV subunit B
MNPDQLCESFFQVDGSRPSNDSLRQITVDDVHHANETIATLMCSSASARRKWLLERWPDNEAMDDEDED